jgi:DNA-binding MarR family transcriptional regulator/GNAT superfamily N-acetyltransferase
VHQHTLEQQIQAVRRFNRFCTQKIGILQEGLLQSPFSLAEVRVLYELAQGQNLTAVLLSKTLELDPGYLSRILRHFVEEGLITKEPSTTDSRQQIIHLTEHGRAVFAPLNERSQQAISTLLNGLSPTAQQQLVAAMSKIERLLDPPPATTATFVLRPHQPGDMGWVVHRHAVLYAQEYGWDERFEALVARITADFIDHFDPQRERCWLAEGEGQVVGSVFVVRQSATVAKLRLLLVEPEARGLGLGARLVQACIDFARQAGYERLSLWTNNVLVAARGIYEKTGFRLVHTEPHASFGPQLIGETWELAL